MRKVLFLLFALMLIGALTLPVFAATSVQSEKISVLSIVLISVSVGAMVGGGTVIGVWLCYRRKKRGESYPLSRYADLYLTESHDRFVGSFVTRVRVQNSNSNNRPGGFNRGR